MTLCTLNLRKFGVILYEGHAGFSVSTVDATSVKVAAGEPFLHTRNTFNCADRVASCVARVGAFRLRSK